MFSDKESFDEFWNQIDDTYDIQCTALQNGAGYELSASKNVSTSEYSRGLAPLFNDTSITKNITLNQDGTISKSTTETTHVRGKGLLTKTWY